MLRSVLAAGLLMTSKGSGIPTIKQTVPADASFLVMGDWGGQSTFPYTTQAQRDVAKGMETKAVKLDSQFVIALGDNFYETGIGGSCNDPRFKETFDSVYTGSGLQKPFYVIPGNHDHYGNVTAQVEFTNIDPTKRWKMPNTYYNFIAESPSWSAQFVMIDTVVLAGNSDLNQTEPEDLGAAQSQLAWIEASLQASKADYLFVAGHYSVFSGAKHGSDKNLDENVLPLLQKYNVTAYLSGHDHTAQYLKLGDLAFIQQGAGHECCYTNNNEKNLPKDVDLQFHLWDSGSGSPEEGSFSSMTLKPTGGSVTYYSPSGKELFTAELSARKA